jgi:hypothetical protein
MRWLRVVMVGLVASSVVGPGSLGAAAPSEDSGTGDGAPGNPAEVTLIRGLVYASGGPAGREQDLQLSLYLPNSVEDPPLLIDTNWAVDPWAVADRGVAVVQLNTPDRWSEVKLDSSPAAIRSMADAVACAVRFARGSDYGSQTAPLLLTGFSRHGATAAHVALAGEDFDRLWDTYAEAMGGPLSEYACSVPEASTRVDGLVGVGGPYDNVVGYDGSSYDSPFARSGSTQTSGSACSTEMRTIYCPTKAR